MKKQLLFLFLLVSSVSLFAQEYALTIKANGFESSEGQAIITIFDNADGFPREKGKAVKEIKSKVENKSVSVEISLPQGEYAVIIFHDENNNQLLDKYWLGMPSEALGCSNCKEKGKPEFERSKFLLDRSMDVEIKMMTIF